MRNNYFLLKVRLFWLACLKKKVTFLKIWNVFLCSLHYFLKTKKSATAPFILSLELNNECNANCLFCRDAKGNIYDTNTLNPLPSGILKGIMPYEMATDIISQIKKEVLIVVLYTNGEPLLYKHLARLIAFCSSNHVMSMIATNGLLLSHKNIHEMLEASIDFIKIQLSGFTQDIYNIQVRYGDIEKLKQNIRSLIEIRNSRKSHTLVMIDYILYNYNSHQLPLIRNFCHDLDIPLNIRPGNPRGGLERREPVQSLEELPLRISCDWLWKGMQINFNGHVLPCCDAVTFSNFEPYHVFKTGFSDVREIWNGEAAQKMRHDLVIKGRKGIPLCAQCYRRGVAFKW